MKRVSNYIRRTQRITHIPGGNFPVQCVHHGKTQLFL